ncbi:MAG: PaaI family thioesterase [Chloroflexi bacterium]|nr:PaaI family thioesterase [Chloroflexota bacterium]
MIKQAHFHKLERMYLSAPINDFYLPNISISNGHAEIQTEVKPKFFHAAGSLHGSVYFKLLDDAAFFAVNSLVEDFFVLTVSFNIYLTRPVFKGVLVAQGQVVSRSLNYFVAESVLTANNKEVAKGSGSFLRSRIKLAEVDSYK